MQEDQKIEEYVLPDDFEENKKMNWKEKLREFLDGRYFVPIVIILIAIIAFSLGRISGLQENREPVRVLNTSSASLNNPLNSPYVKGETEGTPSVSNIQQGAAVGASDVINGQAQPSQNAVAGAVVASKNGTKYHYPWCAGAKQIAEKNLITFSSIEAARASGYTPAANCKGLK